MLCLCGNKLPPTRIKWCSDYCSRNYPRFINRQIHKKEKLKVEIKKHRALIGLFYSRGEYWFKLNHKEIYKKLVKYKLI